MKAVFPELLPEYSHLYNTYRPIEAFLEAHKVMSYAEFDYYSCRDFSLFSLEVDFDFDALSKATDKILATLPSVKRIFAKPIIHLKDGESVLPVESVRTTTQKTINYAATHSETIANITAGGIKPRSLLTKVYEDNYGIYENIVFCNIIDELMSYIRRNWRLLKALIYNSNVLELNLLERVNHLYYFLSLGKLHTGYVRDFGKYYAVAKVDLTKLSYIYDVIQPRLHSAVYKHNKNRNKALAVRLTNIFKLQKDYHRVYIMYRYMQKHGFSAEADAEVPFASLQENYFNYCKMLCLFAIGNFNFRTAEGASFELKALNVDFYFKAWVIHLSADEVKKTITLLAGCQGCERKIVLLPQIKPPNELTDVFIENKDEANSENLVLTPFETDYSNSDVICISKEDIESFRRLQQIVLRAMVYTDAEREECPFCSDKLTYDKTTNSYECEGCRTIIMERCCKATGKKYYQTQISNLTVDRIKDADVTNRKNWRLNQEIEGLMHYRNITRINSKGEPVCPFCNNVH